MQIRKICILGRNSPIFIGPQPLPVSRLVRHSARSAKTVRGQVHHANPTVFYKPAPEQPAEHWKSTILPAECWGHDFLIDLGQAIVFPF